MSRRARRQPGYEIAPTATVPAGLVYPWIAPPVRMDHADRSASDRPSRGSLEASLREHASPSLCSSVLPRAYDDFAAPGAGGRVACGLASQPPAGAGASLAFGSGVFDLNSASAFCAAASTIGSIFAAT